MLFEIGAKVVGMEMDGFRHLIDADARVKAAVHILRNDSQTVHFLCSVLKHSKRNRLKEAANDFKQHRFLAEPGNNSRLLMPSDQLLEQMSHVVYVFDVDAKRDANPLKQVEGARQNAEMAPIF